MPDLSTTSSDCLLIYVCIYYKWIFIVFDKYLSIYLSIYLFISIFYSLHLPSIHIYLINYHFNDSGNTLFELSYLLLFFYGIIQHFLDLSDFGTHP